MKTTGLSAVDASATAAATATAAASATETETAAAPVRRALRSGSWLLAENMLRLGITAVVSFWAARELGPADFGLLNAASALTAMLLAAAMLGLEVPAVLRLARGEASGAVLGTLLRLRLVAAVLALVLAAGLALALRAGEPRAQAVMLIVALSIVALVPTVFDCAFKACVEAGPPARARLATTVLAAGAKAAVLVSGAGVVAMAWTVVLEALLASLLLAHAWHRHSNGPLMRSHLNGSAARLHYDHPTAVSMWRQSLPLLGAGTAVALHLKADVVLLGTLGSDAQAGHYALAQKLSEVLYVLPVVLVDSVYPLLARRAVPSGGEAGANAGGEGRMGRNGGASDQLMFDLAAAAGMLCSLVCLVLAEPLILGVFGAAYAPSVPLWQWHGLTCTAVGLDVARQRWLVARGLQTQVLHTALLGAVLLVALNLLLIPTHGASAAAAIAAVSWSAAGVLATLVWRRHPQTRALAGLQWRALWPWGRLWRLLGMPHGPLWYRKTSALRPATGPSITPAAPARPLPPETPP